MGNDTDDITLLRQRLQQLEVIEREYEQLKHLIDYAVEHDSVPPYSGDIILYADETTHRILDASASALVFLGYPIDSLRALSIDQLELLDGNTPVTAPNDVQNSNGEQIYRCVYRHHAGYTLPVQVYRRLLLQAGKFVLHYFIEDLSLPKRVWHELNRREDAGFQFQQKLKLLNMISYQLSQIDAVDELCREGVSRAIEQLGFDRLSIWFIDRGRQVMVGSYGVDEQGHIRDERHESWPFEGTHVTDFISGKRDPVITHGGAPIYNEKSEIVGAGWHISVPMLNNGQFTGLITADNLLRGYSMKAYEPELLRLYGIMLGHLTALAQARQQTLALSYEQERVRMLKAFITDVGHDFRTPLTSININSYLLKHVRDEDRKNKLVDSIQEAVQYISQIVADMLGLMEMETELELAVEPTTLQDLVREVLKSFQALADKKHIRLKFEPGETVIARVDTYYLTQALSKIVKNAIQYTGDGGRVTLSLRPYGREVGIRVQDSGIGIDQGDIDQIFKPFYRVDKARTRRGSGLGLAIAKVIVDTHKGRILVESVVGQGSRFEVIVPV